MSMRPRLIDAIRAMEYDDFGIWLTTNRMEYGWTMTDVAKKLHTTKQTVSNHTCGRTKVPFVYIIAYCSLFGNKDDPEEIWKLQSGRS